MKDTSGDLSRRRVLRLLSAGGVTGIVGCGQQEDNQSPTDTHGPTPTTTATEATASPGHTATASPSIEAEVSAHEGDSTQILTVTGRATSPAGLDRITVRTRGDRVRIDVDSVQEYLIDVELAVEGGRSYTIDIVAVDSNGTQIEETIRTAHVPIFIDPLETDRLVGAHYYPWYEMHGGHQNWTDRAVSEPVLGEYAANDPKVIDQHLKWCLEHGIRWLSMSWWGRGSGTDRALKNAIVEAERFNDIKFSILYETVGRLEEYDFDLDRPIARSRLRNDLRYLEDTYFQRDNYLHLDERPVVFFYVSNTFHGDVEAAFDEATKQLDTEPYVLADIPFGAGPNAYPVMQVADAITSYSPYSARPDIEDVFHDSYEQGHKVMHLGAEVSDVGFVPVALPGFNDTEIPDTQREDNPILTASPERYERVCEQVSPHLKESEAVLVTSFNEWYENTQIEPNETYDTAYLELTAENLATGSSPGFDPTGVTIRFTFNKTIVPADVNPDSTDQRELAFMAGGFRLIENGEVIRSYNIGSSNEPLFLGGAFGRESNDEQTWRWFGGAEAETTLFVEGDVAGADQLVLIGQPMRSNQIEADVFFDGRDVGHIAFRERDGKFDEYEIRL